MSSPSSPPAPVRSHGPPERPIHVLGISGVFNRPAQMGDGHDPSAVILRNGTILAMASEERFCRVKHASGFFPTEAIRLCLRAAGVSINELDAIAWSNDPLAGHQRWRRAGHHRIKGMVSGFAKRLHESGTHLEKILPVFSDLVKPWTIEQMQKLPLHETFGLAPGKVPFLCIDHHFAHAASAYYASGMPEATVITWDNSGDGISCAIHHGVDGELRPVEEFSSFSMGALYWAVHSFLDLHDEGALMGLAAHGVPRGSFASVADAESLHMHFDRISPRQTSDGRKSPLSELLGPPRLAGESLDARHASIAADVQAVVEEFAFAVLRRALDQTRCRNVAFAGGVALNAVMNGKLARSGLVDGVFIQPNAGDGGGALGAAFEGYRRLGHRVSPTELAHAYWGAEFSDHQIEEALRTINVKFERVCGDRLIELVATSLCEGKIVGWFQGAAEWGPRALGARSILADARDPGTKKRVNAVVKYRDDWRPFGPSILEESAHEFFEDSVYAPFMTMTFVVREHKRPVIPAVVHVDGTTRPQMVRREVAPLYHALLARFGELTGVPVLLNTSFNLKGEPIVNSPVDAIRTFYSSGLDMLAIGSFVLRK